jgi:hypothetical protein
MNLNERFKEYEQLMSLQDVYHFKLLDRAVTAFENLVEIIESQPNRQSDQLDALGKNIEYGFGTLANSIDLFADVLKDRK